MNAAFSTAGLKPEPERILGILNGWPDELTAHQYFCRSLEDEVAHGGGSCQWADLTDLN